jgi:3-hydroxyacyl-CoA dehydrogenase
MPKSKEIQNVAIVSTGVIGASWAALYLGRGLNVVATDPAPNAEANYLIPSRSTTWRLALC